MHPARGKEFASDFSGIHNYSHLSRDLLPHAPDRLWVISGVSGSIDPRRARFLSLTARNLSVATFQNATYVRTLWVGLCGSIVGGDRGALAGWVR